MKNRVSTTALPPDPADSRNTIVEIRAGAGGQESALFAADAGIEQPGKVGLQVRLKPGLPGRELPWDQPPQPAVGEDGVGEPATVEIPFNLLGRVLALVADAGRPVEVDMPGLGVGEDRRVVPELGSLAAGFERGVERRIVEEERVVRLASLEPGLVLELPAERPEHRLDKRFLEALLVAVVLDP